MKQLAATILLAASISSLSAAEWYTGGTLHKKTAREWVLGSPADRLATAADFAATVTKPKTMAQMKVNAVEMESCITTAFTRSSKTSLRQWEQSIGGRTVIDMATACALLLFK